MLDNDGYIDKMVDGYAECAIWSSLDYGDGPDDDPIPLDENYSVDDLADETMTKFREDCEAFVSDNEADLADWTPQQAGHDFWLTRNGHGAGFWDRGKGQAGDRLTDAAHVYGEVNLYIDTEGKIRA